MNTNTGLSERRITGLLLAVGAAIFFLAAGMPLWDANLKSIYSMPLSERYTFILSNQELWAWTCALFMTGTLVALLGLSLLTRLLDEAGEGIYSRLALLTLSCAAILWVIEVSFRLSVGGWARADAANPAATDIFIRLSGWVQVIFIVDTVLTLCGAGAYGISLLLTRLVPRWVGWVAVAFAALGLAILIATGDLPPFIFYIPILVIGVRLLLRPITAISTERRGESQVALQAR